jgi:hypothetical protein
MSALPEKKKVTPTTDTIDAIQVASSIILNINPKMLAAVTSLFSGIGRDT